MNSITSESALADFPAKLALPVQWGDQDAFGHINNVIYFRWFESARIAYLEQSGLDPLLTAHGLGPILANVSCNFRKQVLYPDQIVIGARIGRMGRTSMVMHHAIFSGQQQCIVADGDSIVVAYNYREQRSVELSPDIRACIERFETKSRPADPPGLSA